MPARQVTCKEVRPYYFNRSTRARACPVHRFRTRKTFLLHLTWWYIPCINSDAFYEGNVKGALRCGCSRVWTEATGGPFPCRTPVCEMVGICSEDSSFRTKLVQTLLTILYLLSLINHGGAEHVVLLNHGATGSESEQGRDLSHQDSFPFSVSSWEEARVRKELQASREIPAIRGVATHHFFEYASQVAVELLKLNFKKVRRDFKAAGIGQCRWTFCYTCWMATFLFITLASSLCVQALALHFICTVSCGE